MSGAAQYESYSEDVGSTLGFVESAKALSYAAAAGDLEVEPGAADEQIALVREMQDYLKAELPKLIILREPPPLSSTTPATWASNLMLQVGTDDNGFLTRLQQLFDALPHWEQALTDAKKKYQETEAAHTDAMNRTGPRA